MQKINKACMAIYKYSYIFIDTVPVSRIFHKVFFQILLALSVLINNKNVLDCS